jgi:2',3'-cyclic-nucleotide 2'-phosphodiesterase/3'-nucleotidase
MSPPRRRGKARFAEGLPMRLTRPLVLAVLLALAPASAAELKLRILATTDLHMNLVDYDFVRDEPDESIGLNRVAALIAEARTENPNAILVDAGDLLQGAPMGDVVARVQPLKDGEIHPAYAAMNLLRYDAAAIGNHEFNFGLDLLERAQLGRDFPTLAANVYRANPDGSAGETLFPPSVLLTRSFKDDAGADRQVKIGVIGVLPPQIMNWDKDKLTGKLVTSDAVEAVEREVPKLKADGADLIVVIAHAGISAAPRQGGDENFALYLGKVEGVDAVVTGHSHRIFPGKDYEGLTGADLKRGTIDGKPYVMAGSFGSHLGVIDILLDDASGTWAIKNSQAEARPVATKGEDSKTVARLPADPAVTDLVKPWTEATLAYIRAPIGEAKGPFNTYLALLGDTAALRLVADAQTDYVQKMVQGTEYEGLPLLSAAAPFRVGGRPGPDYYTDVKAGPIAIKDAADLYIYPNMLTVVKLKGSEVREYLEKATRIFNQIDPAKAGEQPLIGNMPAYNFDILFGLTYAIDVTQPLRYGRGPAIEDPNAHRVSDIRYNGEPLNDDADYLVITNNYRANGGGEFPRMDGSAIALVAPETNREILIDYIRAKKDITPDNTPVWRFVPVADGPDGPPDVRIEIGPGGAALAAADPRLAKVGATETGFDVYRVKLSQ